jgi:hypothetical protein
VIAAAELLAPTACSVMRSPFGIMPTRIKRS